jgi:hypothetical protein
LFSDAVWKNRLLSYRNVRLWGEGVTELGGKKKKKKKKKIHSDV